MGKKKKQRLTTDAETEPESNPINGNIDDSHGNKKLKKIKKNKTNEEIATVSIAVPASIIDNVPTLELATRVSISKLLSFPSQKHYFYSKNQNLIHSAYVFLLDCRFSAG